MSLTAPTRYSMRLVQVLAINSYPVRNGMTIYYGALVGLSTVGVTDGRLVNWSASSGALRFCGIAQPTQQVSAGSGTSGQVTGNSAGTVECPVYEGGAVLENVSVTGLSAAQNVGDPVYASDENTFTLSATSNVGAVGHITRYITGTRGDIQLYSKQEYFANENIGKV